MAFQQNMFTKSLIQKWEDPCVFTETNERKSSTCSNKALLKLSCNFKRVEFELNNTESLSQGYFNKKNLFEEAQTQIDSLVEQYFYESDFGSPINACFKTKTKSIMFIDVDAEKKLRFSDLQFGGRFEGFEEACKDIQDVMPQKSNQSASLTKRKQSLQVKIGRTKEILQMTGQIEIVKQKAQRRFSLKISDVIEEESKFSSGFETTSAASDSDETSSKFMSTVDVHDNKITDYKDAAKFFMIHMKSQSEEKHKNTIADLDTVQLKFPYHYDFVTSTFHPRNDSSYTKRPENNDICLSKLAKYVKKIKADNNLMKIKKTANKTTKKSTKKTTSVPVPSVFDINHTFPVYLSVENQFQTAVKLYNQSSNLNQISNPAISQINKNYYRYEKIQDRLNNGI